MDSFSNHPNPQFERKEWQSLNGSWDCGFQKARTAFHFSKNADFAMKLYRQARYTHKINVPFCVESQLSGIGYTGFVNAVWYKREVEIAKKDKRVFLHIGAADYLTTVLVNGVCAGRHTGGYTSFAFDITDYVRDGENELFILCEDNVKDPLVPGGKQSTRKNSYASRAHESASRMLGLIAEERGDIMRYYSTSGTLKEA